jgi:hypothetical protein
VGEEAERVRAAVVVGPAAEEGAPVAVCRAPAEWAAVCRGQAAAPCRGQVGPVECRAQVGPVECRVRVAADLAAWAEVLRGRVCPAIVHRWATSAVAGSAPTSEMLAVVSDRISAMRRGPRWAVSVDRADRAARTARGPAIFHGPEEPVVSAIRE